MKATQAYYVDLSKRCSHGWSTPPRKQTPQRNNMSDNFTYKNLGSIFVPLMGIMKTFDFTAKKLI